MFEEIDMLMQIWSLNMYQHIISYPIVCSILCVCQKLKSINFKFRIINNIVIIKYLSRLTIQTHL